MTPVRLCDGDYWRQYLNCSQVEQWLLKAVAESVKPGTIPGSCPEEGPASYTLPQVASLAQRSLSTIEKIVQSDQIRLGPDGKAPRAEVDRWLEECRQKRGGSDRPDCLSLQDAARQSQHSVSSLKKLWSRGLFGHHTNAQGQPLLERRQFEAWMLQRPPASHQVGPEAAQFTLKQIADMLHLKLATVQKDVAKGLLKATPVRHGLHFYYGVSAQQLRAWMEERQRRYPQATLEGRGTDNPTSLPTFCHHLRHFAPGGNSPLLTACFRRPRETP